MESLSRVENDFMEGKLEELREKIVSDRDVVLYDEVKRSFLSGAYRLAYIGTWINIAESIKNKFRDMAIRDSEIRKLVSKIDAKEENERPTDKLLLDSALDYGLVDKVQHSKLGHIKDMRGMYAHPTECAPNPQEVLSAISIGVEAILSQPPLLRHNYVKTLVTSIFDEHHFVDDTVEAVDAFAKDATNRIHSSVHPYLLKLMAERLELIINDPTARLFRDRASTFINSFFEKVKPDFSEEKWDMVDIIRKYPQSSSMLFSHASFWPLISQRAKDMIVGHLLEPVKGEDICKPSVSELTHMHILQQKGLLSDRHLERFCSALKKVSCSDKANVGIPLADYITDLITDLASHDWYRQNPAVEGLSIAGHEQCAMLKASVQEELGRNILQAAQGNAKSAIVFMSYLAKGKEQWPENFVRGVVLECFVNEYGQLRFKRTFLKNALITASKLPVHVCKNIINKVTAEIESSVFKDEFLLMTEDGSEFEEVKSIVAAVVSSGLHEEEVILSLQGLASKVDEAKSKLSS